MWTALRTKSLLFLLFAVCLYSHTPRALKETYRKGHDGSTVDRILTRLGEGTAHFDDGAGTCSSTNCKNEDRGEGDICWGYEKDCSEETRLFIPQCDEPPKPWASTMEDKMNLFWKQGDFGYVKNEVDSMIQFCSPSQGDWQKEIEKGASLLTCSAQMRYCKAHNLYIDFRRYREMVKKEGRYRSLLEDIFEEGEIGGHCQLNSEAIRTNGEHKSPLQSWYAELGSFSSLKFRINKRSYCDEIVDQSTIFIKLDAVVNIYHHFCDFFNLYASQHINGSFSDDVQIVIWDTTSSKELRDPFIDTWSAFTKHPIRMLSNFEGKRVCFKDAVFSLLARMRHGLYYNTYLVPGCRGSGLMQAFTKHLLPRLGIRQEISDPQRLRVTLLSRTTRHRRFVNENELVNAMKTVGYFDVRVVDYKFREYPFLDQIESSHNSDIFMGIHGAGLTHMIFLPDWGAVFEMYNTGDPKCYHDLARLRGIEYITWEKEDKIWQEAEGYSPTSGKPSPKFTNYTLDVTEMMRLVTALGDRVRERKMEALSNKLFTHTTND